MKTTLRLLAAACLYVTTAFAQNQLTANLTVTNQEIVGAAAGTVPYTAFEVDSTSTSSPRGIMSAQFNTGTDGARFHFRKARGTRAAPTTVVTGDNLGRLVGTGYDGSNYLEMASIYFATEGTIAATRVPTNIQFWTATNAAPSVLTLAATINSSQQFLNNVGSSTAPSYSFAGDTGTGFYQASGSIINMSFGGVQGGRLQLDSTGGVAIRGAANGNLLNILAAGGFSLTAAGTNQSITLTPSGSGSVQITGGNGVIQGNGTTNPSLRLDYASGFITLAASGTNQNISLVPSGTGSTLLSGAYNAFFTADGTSSANSTRLGWVALGSTTVAGLRFISNSTTQAQIDAGLFDSSGNFGTSKALALNSAGGDVLIGNTGTHVVIGGSTVGTGTLQFLSTAGDNTSGISFRANTYLYGSADGVVTLQHATAPGLRIRSSSGGRNLTANLTDGTNAATLQTSGFSNSAAFRIGTTEGSARSLILTSGADVAAATFDGSQNATLAANLAYVGSLSGDNGTITTNGSGLINKYGGINTAGNGIVSVQGAGRQTAQTGSVTAATYTVGGADASFEVSANILVTTATTHAFTCTCAYTDEGNTARTITFTFSNVGGTFLTSIANTGGTVPYEGVPLHIRAKASTTITIATTGTFTSVVYNVEGVIRKLQ